MDGSEPAVPSRAATVARSGWFAWAVLGAAILAWDMAAADQQTLSETFGRACAAPRNRAAVHAGWLLVTLHLFGVLPPRADPLHAVHALRHRARQAAERSRH